MASGVAADSPDAPPARSNDRGPLRPKDSSVHLPGIGTVSFRTLMTLAVIVAAILRTIWAVRFGLSLEQEGVEYARIGENLLAGRGYVGIFNNGTQLNFPPLYPMMIAALTFVIGNSEIAARVINIACGAALVIPIAGIAGRVYGRRAAMVAMALAVFHPVLIAGGGASYAEGPYLTLLMAALFCLTTYLLDNSLRAGTLGGMFLGLAYLVRPEAVVLVIAFVAIYLLSAVFSQDLRMHVRGALAFAVAFFLVALPNIVFLTVSTGKLRVEAKGTLAYQWGERINSGMSYEESIMGIGDDLSDQGVFMKPNAEVLNAAAPTTIDHLRFLIRAARRNANELIRAIVNERAFGSPLLFVLAVIGLFRSGWERRRLMIEGLLLLTFGLTLAILLTVQALWFRYYYPLLGFLIIWGAKGADELYSWGRATAGALVADRPLGSLAGQVLQWGTVAAVLAVALVTLPRVDQYRESRFPERARAGEWIATQLPKDAWVMDSGLQVAYYAKASLRFLPYADSNLALRYISKHKPDFIVLEGLGKHDLPYLAQWFDTGIPDKRAVLVHYEGSPLREEIKIYRWNESSP
jgi:4-amino-4-deoxy-L-arabinose transferase-like glycosyltransferase